MQIIYIYTHIYTDYRLLILYIIHYVYYIIQIIIIVYIQITDDINIENAFYHIEILRTTLERNISITSLILLNGPFLGTDQIKFQY